MSIAAADLNHSPIKCGSAPRFAERTLRNISPGSRGSLRLDVGVPDHSAPFFGVFDDELAEVGGRANKHGPTKVGDPRPQSGIGEARVDLFVELVADLCGRIPGLTDSLPACSLL